MAYDELSRRFIGYDGDTTHELRDSVWQKVCSGGGNNHGLAWDPTSRRLLRCEGEGLASFDGSSWTPVATSTADAHVGADLVADPDRRTLLPVGGQDFDERGGHSCADTFVSEAGARFHKATCSMPRVVVRYATGGIISGRQAIVNHSSRTLLLRANDLQLDRFPLRKKSHFDEAFDDRYSNCAYSATASGLWAATAPSTTRSWVTTWRASQSPTRSSCATAIVLRLRVPDELQFPAHTMNHSAFVAFDPVAGSMVFANEDVVYELLLDA